MRSKKKLGEMLVEAKLISDDQLKETLKEHQKSEMKLGHLLIQKGLVRENQIVTLISQQLKIQRYRPDQYPIDLSLEQIINLEIARKYQLAPLNNYDNLLKIAMIDPLDITALDEIEAITNSEVEPFICTEKELNQLMFNIYSLSSDLDGVLESIGDTESDSTDRQKKEHIQISSLKDMAGEPPVVRLVNSIFTQAEREGASDIHISPERKSMQVRFRIDGNLYEVPSPPKNMLLPIVSRIKILANMDISNFRIPQDGRLSLKIKNKFINIRISTIPTIYGENLVMRVLDRSSGVMDLKDLGLSKEDLTNIETAIQKPYGMILSAGPTGSGKTSTLFSILHKINKPDINIITLEDPVEYQVDKIRQVQLNKKAGMTFASGLRSILRQDPDVILVGEIRDSETAMISVQAALTGHRLLSTLHANDSVGAITRLRDMGVEPFLISSVLLVSIAQRLIRTVCEHCKEPYTPSPEILKAWGLNKYPNANFMRGVGCTQCMSIGYKGRTGIYEILNIDEDIQDMILKGLPAIEIKKKALEAKKYRTLKENATEKIVNGITTIEEAASAIMM